MVTAAGAILGRIVQGRGDDEPAAVSEYLRTVQPVDWTRRRAEALFFRSYEEADALARSLRCFALVTGRANPAHVPRARRDWLRTLEARQDAQMEAMCP